MKNIIALLLALTLTASAATLNLDWDNNAPSDQVTGYCVYASLNGGASAKLLTVQTNTAQLPSLPAGLYVFNVTATNAWGESAKSLPVSTSVGAGNVPVGLKIRIVLP